MQEQPAATDQLTDLGPAADGEVRIGAKLFYTLDRLAAVLGVSVRTLARWHADRSGPPRFERGRVILYDAEKVVAWMAANELGPVGRKSRSPVVDLDVARRPRSRA